MEIRVALLHAGGKKKAGITNQKRSSNSKKRRTVVRCKVQDQCNARQNKTGKVDPWMERISQSVSPYES